MLCKSVKSKIFNVTACKERDAGLVSICWIMIVIKFYKENGLSGIGGFRWLVEMELQSPADHGLVKSKSFSVPVAHPHPKTTEYPPPPRGEESTEGRVNKHRM